MSISSKPDGAHSWKLLIIRHFLDPSKLVRRSLATGTGIAPRTAVLWHKGSHNFKEMMT